MALHAKIEPGKFQEKANWSDEELQEKIQFLMERGWLLNDDRGIRPIVFIASDHQGQDLFKRGLPLSEGIADAIEKEIPSIMEMEAAYLKKENRPERHGKIYYASIE